MTPAEIMLRELHKARKRAMFYAICLGTLSSVKLIFLIIAILRGHH